MIAAASVAAPPRNRLESPRGRLAGFPGDSIDLSVMTFTVDGDTVSREAFFNLDRTRIRTLTVIPAPANLIEVETREAALAPLPADSLPSDIVYVIDGVVADRTAYSALPASAISSVAVVRSGKPRIEITTRRAARRPR